MNRFKSVGFIGLGSMGGSLAGSLSKIVPVRGFDATQATTDALSKTYPNIAGEKSVAGVLSAINDTDGPSILFSCLPKSSIVEVVKDEILCAKKDTSELIWVDCTSGSPTDTQRISKEVAKVGITFVDCPVSGGPRGAAAGTLTAMMGSDDDEAVRTVTPLVESFAKNIVHIGPSGSGHAVKAVNNTLLGVHIALVAEGLIALKKIGVHPQSALDAINGSSGRSWVSMQRFPDHVLPQTYDYGFSLELLLKDMNIGVDLIDDVGSRTQYLRGLKDAIEREVKDVDAAKVDHLEISKVIESKNACKLDA